MAWVVKYVSAACIDVDNNALKRNTYAFVNAFKEVKVLGLAISSTLGFDTSTARLVGRQVANEHMSTGTASLTAAAAQPSPSQPRSHLIFLPLNFALRFAGLPNLRHRVDGLGVSLDEGASEGARCEPAS
jgi:hypothetical protein